MNAQYLFPRGPRPSWITQVLLLLTLSLGIVFMTGCDDALTGAEDTSPAGASPSASPETAEHIQQDYAAQKARRKAYLEKGIVPSVPPSLLALSPNPEKPEFIFEGYAKPGTSTDALEAQRRADAADDDPEEDARGDVETDLGVFISAATGETWRWKPDNIEQRVQELRASSGQPLTATETPSYAGLGAPRGDEADTLDTASKVLGSDGRQIRSKTSGHCLTCYPWRAIGALAPNGTGSNSPNAGCTATKIGPRHLLTAGHCVHEGGNGGSWFWADWWPGQDGMDQWLNGGDPSPNGVYDIQWYWVHSSWLSSGQNNRDYAVLILYDSPQAVGLGWFGLKVDNTLANTSAWNFGYPAWGNTCANSIHPANSCRQSLWGHSQKITHTSISYAYYKHDTQGGHSGSPIYQYNGGNRQIVAVHKGGYSNYHNRGIKVNSTVFDNIMNVKAAWPSAFD